MWVMDKDLVFSILFAFFVGERDVSFVVEDSFQTV